MIERFADDIFVTGYAKLPSNITATKMYEVIAVGLLIKTYTGEIIEAECTLSTSLANRVVAGILIGKNIREMDDIEHELDVTYFGSAKKAIKTAVQNCKKKFESIFDNEDFEE